MRKRYSLILPAVALSAAVLGGMAVTRGRAQVGGGTPHTAATPAAPAPTAEIDKPIKAFTLRNIASDKKDAMVNLADFKGKKAVVAIFMANRCGTTWTYEQRMGDLVKDYQKKDVAIVAVHSNYGETDGEIMGQIEQRNLPFPVLDDKKTQDFARYIDARATPTFVVIDKAGVLRYRGAFDKMGDPSVAYVRPALDAVLSGKEVAVKTSRAFG